VVRCAFASNDLRGCTPHLFGQHGFALSIPANPFSQGHTSNPRGGPEHDFGIAMFTHDVSMDRVGIDVNLAADDLPETRGIEHRTGTHYPIGRQARHVRHHLREDVNWIGHHHDDAATAAQSSPYFRHHGSVLAQQV
jgi:hypothetical protein